MDNVYFYIRGDYKNFASVIIYLKSLHKQATHYAIVPRKGLVLFWSNPNTNYLYFEEPNEEKDNIVRLKVEIVVKEFEIPWEKFVEAWYTSVPLKDFDLHDWERDINSDGSTGRGFTISCDKWGHVGDSFYAFAIIKPIVAWYGK